MSQASVKAALRKAGIHAEDLDELVQDACSAKASNINNDGFDSQLVFLRGEIGDTEVLKHFEITE